MGAGDGCSRESSAPGSHEAMYRVFKDDCFIGCLSKLFGRREETVRGGFSFPETASMDQRVEYVFPAEFFQEEADIFFRAGGSNRCRNVFLLQESEKILDAGHGTDPPAGAAPVAVLLFKAEGRQLIAYRPPRLFP